MRSVGILIIIFIIWSPLLYPSSGTNPWDFKTTFVPGWVPGFTSISSFSSRVLTSSLQPKAACAKDIFTFDKTSSPSLLNSGCGFTFTVIIKSPLIELEPLEFPLPVTFNLSPL